MSVKILSKRERFGVIKEANWASPAAANATFKLCQWINAGTPNPNPDAQVDQFNVTSQNGIHSEVERFFIDATSGLPTIPFSGTCEKATMAMFLAGAYQVVTEASSSPFNKVITCGGLTAPIDFAGSAGITHTIAVDQDGSADDGVILENAIIQNLNIVWDLNARGVARLVNMNGTWVGNELNYEQSLSGTWTNATISQAGFFNNTDAWIMNSIFTVGEVDYSAQCVRKVEAQVNNNVTSNCKTTGGKANQYDIAPEYKTIITLDYNDSTEKMLQDFTTGAEVTFNWTNDSAAAKTDGKWTYTPLLYGGRLISPPKVYNGDFLGIQLDVRQYSLAAASPITINYCDTVDYVY